ncbi:hypothetical protein [Herbidospora cretacea]|uniref:hypothetical protein n=1 Tax=Herbidospora cretacea TaxID=28444 RepID=UPI000B12221A|nr:hypothetical protein [Herbidospora cretacea]
MVVAVAGVAVLIVVVSGPLDVKDSVNVADLAAVLLAAAPLVVGIVLWARRPPPASADAPEIPGIPAAGALDTGSPSGPGQGSPARAGVFDGGGGLSVSRSPGAAAFRT